MVENEGHSEREDFRGARIQVLGTNIDDPAEGRIFVWTKMGWFERIEGPWGDVAFTPVAESEEELRELVSKDNPKADLSELSGEFKKMVSAEFRDQSPVHPDSLEDSQRDTDEGTDDDEDDQEYHQHDYDRVVPHDITRQQKIGYMKSPADREATIKSYLPRRAQP